MFLGPKLSIKIKISLSFETLIRFSPLASVWI